MDRIQHVIESITKIKTTYKKPNDIYLDGKKLGGVLIEAEQHSQSIFSNYSIFGIGLNLNQAQFSGPLNDSAISLFQKTGTHVNKYAVIGMLNMVLDTLYPPPINNGMLH